MRIKEIIKTLEIAKSEVEWHYPMDYTIAFEEAAEILGNAAAYSWHKMEKEIPEEGTECLVLLKGYEDSPVFARYSKNNKAWNSDLIEAWFPVPKYSQ